MELGFLTISHIVETVPVRYKSQPCESQRCIATTVMLGVVVTGPLFSWGDTYRMIVRRY
jgi:hypothetical protein